MQIIYHYVKLHKTVSMLGDKSFEILTPDRIFEKKMQEKHLNAMF